MARTPRVEPEIARREEKCSYEECGLGRIIEKGQVVMRSGNNNPYHEVCYREAQPDLADTVTIREDQKCDACPRIIKAGNLARQIKRTGKYRHTLCHKKVLDRNTTMRSVPDSSTGISGGNVKTANYSPMCTYSRRP